MNLAEAMAAARSGQTGALAEYLAHPPADESRDHWITAVLDALSDKAFRRMHEGRRLEALAIEAVLACGYPGALRVTPEQLDVLRNEHARRSPWVSLVFIGGLVVFSCVILDWVFFRWPN